MQDLTLQIYSTRSKSEARRYQELPPSPTEPQVGAVLSQPVQQETKTIPEVAPMRRGRPGKPSHSHHKDTSSPYRGPSTDPFAILDGKAGAKKESDELSNRFPTLDQFHILHEKGDKFDFEPTVADDKEDDDLSRRLTNALADDAFVKRPSPERAAASESYVDGRPQAVPSKLKSPALARREEPRKPPLHQPVPQKPAMVSTGTMTSPSPAPDVERKPSSRPIFRFLPPDHDRPSSQSRVLEERKPSGQGRGPSPPSHLQSPRLSSDRLSALSASARPSLEGGRPSSLDVNDPVASRSKSANSKIRPVSIHAGSRFELPRQPDSTRSSVDLTRTPDEGGAPLKHARTDMDRDFDRANITSDVDYLRAKEEEESNRKKEKRNSSTSKHTKRPSLTSLSLSGTKTLFGGRFGDAFRRFESSHPDSKPQSPAPEEVPKQPTIITATEVEEPEDMDREDDISPEMRREFERRRASQEEKRVANAAADYRRRVAEQGEGGRDSDGPRATSIQNRVQSLFGESNKPTPQKTASGYGRYTETEAAQSQPESHIERPASSAYTAQLSAKDKWEKAGVIRPQTATATATATEGYAQVNRTGPRPALPPKPKNLRVSTQPGSRPSSQQSPVVKETPVSPTGGDWEASFSRRYPSLSGLEMVETEIEIPKVTSLRTKEV